MTNTLIAALASAGLLTVGVAATATQTRSDSAMTVSPAPVSRTGAKVAVARAAARPDCTLESNAQLPECANAGRSGAVFGGTAHSGVSGVVLGVLAAGGIGTAVALAAKSDSNG